MEGTLAEKIIKLKNVSFQCSSGPVPFQASMYHEVVCTARQVCTCKTLHPEAKGKPIRNPKSFRINVGEVSEELPGAVLQLAQVKAAIKNGILVVVDEAAKVEVL